MFRKIGLVLAATAALYAGTLLGGILSVAQEVVTPAGDTTVNVGSPIINLLLAYSAALGTLVAGLASWVMLKITGIRLDAEARQAIETFATNAAGEFLNNFDTLKNVKVDVHNQMIAQLANAALTRIPDGLARFGWNAEQVKQRIVEKIGVLTAPGTTTTVTAAAPPRV